VTPVEASRILAYVSGWSVKEVESQPDSAHWKASERIGEARRVLEAERRTK
jgi:hypothetical protein